MFSKFQKIGAFRGAVKRFCDRAEFHKEIPPTVSYIGTIKLHGTNASIVLNNGEVSFCSRKRELAIGDDNAGFAGAMSALNLAPLLECAKRVTGLDNFAIYGEWAGKGVIKGAAISQIEKTMFIFGVKDLDADCYLSMDVVAKISDPEGVIKNICDYPTYEMDIDFSSPEKFVNKIVSITDAIDKECPVASTFGIKGFGEGVVWSPRDRASFPDNEFVFKVKGEKHSVSKVKTTSKVDEVEIANIKEFVSLTVTENRLDQGVAHLKEMGLPLDRSSTATYIRWVVNDVMTEEADLISTKSINKKKLPKEISRIARTYLFEKIDSF